MKKIAFVTPPDARYGFSLTGVRQLAITPDELHEIVLELISDQALGVLVIDERLIDGAAQERLAAVERRWPGLIIVLPAPEKTAQPEEDYTLRLIRRAIGYQVRLNL